MQPTKLRVKHRVPRNTLTVKKKRDNMKTASLCKRRNPNNTYAQKLKKAQLNLKKRIPKSTNRIHSRPDR